MSGASAIEWTEMTWNPVTGCDKVSPGCAHCYAETFAERWRGIPGHPYEQGFDLKLWPERLGAPLRWRKPRMVFVNSMSDLFHEDIPDSYIEDVFAVMAEAEQHTFQVLTKRPERMREVVNRLMDSSAFYERVARWVIEGPLPNVWLGVSIENRRFVQRADVLRETPAAVRFISAEPLLGPLIYDDIDSRWGQIGHERRCWSDGHVGPELDLAGIDWCIGGGESGPGHRRLDVQWMRDLRDACAESRTAYFVKQLGGSRPGTSLEDLPEDLRIREFPR